MDSIASLTIPGDLAELAALRRFVAEAAAARGSGAAAVEDLVLAVNELATNVIVHGYRGPGGALTISVWREGDQLAVRLVDRAPPFDPTAVPAPDTSLPLHQRRLGGMGLHLTRHSVDRMVYHALPEGGNELVVTRTLAQE